MAITCNHMSMDRATSSFSSESLLREASAVKRSGSRFLPALLTLFVALGLSLWGYKVSRDAYARENAARFRTLCDQVLQEIKKKFLAYEVVLRAVAQYVAFQEKLLETPWQDFIRQIRRVPGTEALREIMFVRPQTKYPNSRGSQLSRDKKNFAGQVQIEFFSPSPSNKEKLKQIEAEFKDIENPFRYSSRTGFPGLSGKINLWRSGKENFVLLCFPIYDKKAKSQGREQVGEVIGWVTGWIEVERLMRAALAPYSDRIDVEVYDGEEPEESSLLFSSLAGKKDLSDPFTYARKDRRNFKFGGRSWSLLYLFKPYKGAQYGGVAPLVVLFIGILASLILSGLVGVVTARKTEAVLLAETMTAAFRESEIWAQKLAQIAARTDKAAVILDPQGDIEWVNRSFCELTEFSEEEVLSRNFASVLGDLMVDPLALEQISEALRQKRSYQGEILVASRFGRTFWLALEIQPSYDEEGQLVNFTALASNITQHKLVQEKLLGAKEAAEAANKAKSHFLANMSHEIRTPINGVVGMLKLLERTDLSQKQRRYVRTAVASADALMSVINDILDFSKIEAGKLELENIAFDLYRVVENVMTMFAERAERKGLELAYVVSKEVPRFVKGDPNRLGQVLINLVGNAVKFTESGEVTLRIGLDRISEKEATCRFIVQDTGIGMNERQKARLFEPFSQGDPTTTRRYGGTGLGLAISRELVEKMGGFMGFQSSQGVGTTFWFVVTFPIEAVPTDCQEDTSALVGFRVLVVDDHEVSREMFQNLLESWGCEVEQAADSEEALRRLEESEEKGSPFKLVLIDRWLGKEDGLDLGRKIAGREGRNLPLVLLTTVSDTADEQAKEAGFLAAVAKPLRRAELLGVLLSCAQEKVFVESSEKVPRRPSERVGCESLGAKVLVAEDNEINQEIVVEILQTLGCQCDCVSTGREACEAVRSKSYDLVLMDWHMPEMDGFEACRQIRRWEEERSKGGEVERIPVIALTANAMKGDRDRCKEAGMDDYISKPVDPEKLLEVIKKYTGVSRGSGEGPRDGAGAFPREEEGEILDYQALLGRCMGKEELARSLIRKFCGKVRKDLCNLERACKEGDLSFVAALSHKIKGSAANMGANLIRAQSENLELAAKEGSKEKALKFMEALTEAFSDLLDYLKKNVPEVLEEDTALETK